jgi:hypothetical protein
MPKRVWERRNPLVLFVSLVSLLPLAAIRGASSGPLRLPLQVEKLTAPEGVTLPSYEAVELLPVGGGRYDVRLTPGDSAPRLSGVDLTLLVPRVPRLARGNETLTRLALIQREFNRNEVHNPLPDGSDFSIANNCLQRGLWEIKLVRTDGGKTLNLFHAWFTFPQEEYARLFGLANDGLEEQKYDAEFANYPGMGGFELPLADLRSIRSEQKLQALDGHAADPLDRLPEQKNKTKWIRTAGLDKYGDVVRTDSQPVTLAKFNVPGLYDPKESMQFDLAWLAHPKGLVWREARSSRTPQPFPELELRFENGFRILAADAKLASLSARSAAPTGETDGLKLVCGIGTPVIHATAEERAAEMAEDRPRYLMILDAKGNHLDNHLTGVDGVYVWREAGSPGRLHLWLVSYERIALVAHYSAPWPEHVALADRAGARPLRAPASRTSSLLRRETIRDANG